MPNVIIDVREKDEFSFEHINNSINIPLSDFTHVAPGVLNLLRDRKIIFMCRSGARAQQAQGIANGFGFEDAHEFEVFKGGILEWKKRGEATVSMASNKAPLPLSRQVQIVIGLLTITFALLGVFVNPAYGYAAAAMGAGVLLAGATGFCALATFMSKLPWNSGGDKDGRVLCRRKEDTIP
jgi:rhodanese-related sulfurtransferase